MNAILLCIGTDLVIGDCLGPIVGEILINRNVNAYVYGTLTRPVTAKNLTSYIEFIKSKHNLPIIAIDSCVGENIGNISLKSGPLAPGAADGKKLPLVGDLSITATTCAYPPSDKRFAAVRVGFVYSLALKVADLITDLISR
ncbi:sporulation protein YyaC [Firmicutes bacterium CAG:552]|jgi:putative sporulation protein YyaC|nr:sporulation protein YyaC [Firmicutes bacterium CAG:552]